MIYLTIEHILRQQEKVIAKSGGLPGVKDLGLLESAVAQPAMTFGGEELYPTLWGKAGALAFSLCRNHAFEDGNKRIAQTAMESFLIWNGFEIDSPIDEQERIFLKLASGELSRDDFVVWIHNHLKETTLPG